jgi:protein tyrosine phosphatase (PTP) superfamily phosphohydrolase (DUF442 family)
MVCPYQVEGSAESGDLSIISFLMGVCQGNCDIRLSRATVAVMSEDHSADRAHLLALVPADGSAVGNTALIRQLGWTQNRYWYARDSLLEAGVIVRAKGRGGAVRRAHPEDSTVPTTAAEAELIGEAALAYVHEADLYPAIKATLETFWAKERQIEPLAVEITASQGRKATGGRWTRPDLVSVAVRTYRYLPGKYMEVVTFEVKPADAITVTAVYEALAHLRSATHAYVIFHVPDDSSDSTAQVIDEARRVGRAHGVGVITMSDPKDWETWNELEEARRVEPDPERLDEFISVQLGQDAHDRIARALH